MFRAIIEPSFVLPQPPRTAVPLGTAQRPQGARWGSHGPRASTAHRAQHPGATGVARREGLWPVPVGRTGPHVSTITVVVEPCESRHRLRLYAVG
eukprot:4825071-Prymnesium_polylepis.1